MPLIESKRLAVYTEAFRSRRLGRCNYLIELLLLSAILVVHRHLPTPLLHIARQVSSRLLLRRYGLDDGMTSQPRPSVLNVHRSQLLDLNGSLHILKDKPILHQRRLDSRFSYHHNNHLPNDPKHGHSSNNNHLKDNRRLEIGIN